MQLLNVSAELSNWLWFINNNILFLSTKISYLFWLKMPHDCHLFYLVEASVELLSLFSQINKFNAQDKVLIWKHLAFPCNFVFKRLIFLQCLNPFISEKRSNLEVPNLFKVAIREVQV